MRCGRYGSGQRRVQPWLFAVICFLSVLGAPSRSAQPAALPEPPLEACAQVSVRASDPSVEMLALDLSRGAGAMLARVSQRLELPPPERVLVLVVPRVPRGRKEAVRLGLGQVPSWAAGFAQPEQNRVVVFANRVGGYAHPSLPGTMAHEFAHLIVGVNLPRGAFIPRWYDEGIAQLVERDLSIYEALQLARMTIMAEPPPLRRLRSAWPADAAQARDAYALSLSFVDFAEENTLAGAPQRLVMAMRAGALFDEAFRSAYGARRAHFERLWRASLEDRYLYRPLWVLFSLANAVMGVLALVAVIRVRRRNRVRLETWEEEERFPPHG